MCRAAFLAFLLTPLLLFVSSGAQEGQSSIETIEWSDIWVRKANRNDLPRVLLVGDSIVRGYFDGVEKRLKGKANCARYTTSKFMGNPDFLAELEVLLQGYRFDVIHINNGLHGWAYAEAQYAESFSPLFACFEKHAKETAVVWATTTPMRTGRKLTEFHEKNGRVKERNRIALEVMAKRGIPVNDLYGLVEERPEFYTKDGVHFSNEGKKAQADRVAEAVLMHLPGNTDQ